MTDDSVRSELNRRSKWPTIRKIVLTRYGIFSISFQLYIYWNKYVCWKKHIRNDELLQIAYQFLFSDLLLFSNWDKTIQLYAKKRFILRKFAIVLAVSLLHRCPIFLSSPSFSTSSSGIIKFPLISPSCQNFSGCIYVIICSSRIIILHHIQIYANKI